MKIFKTTLILGALFLSNVIEAQETIQKYTATNKGKFYVYWGGNRGYYSGSDIRFKGTDYDFTLENASAHDKPKGWHVDYINPARITIPQTNFRLGYFFSDHYNVSIGVDHMKYVMTQNQEVGIKGHYPNQGSYGELLPNGNVLLTEEFVTFEHTDGLNYVNAEINRVDDISKYVYINDTDKIQLNTTVGVGTGLLYPKTNAQMFGRQRYDDFKVSGFGFSAKAGLNLTFYKHFFIQYEAKVGYIDITNARISQNSSDKAMHHFTIFESIIAIGGIFRL